MMTLARRSRRGFAAPSAPLPRTRLFMEQLEDRSLLSATGLQSSLGGYEPDRILVQFQPELSQPNAQAILPGSQLGQSFRLLPGLREVTLPAGVSVARGLAAFQASPFVVYAEPNYVSEVEYIPNDSRWNTLYGMQRISAGGAGTTAWDWWTGGTTAVVAVMDTGVYMDHEDLYLNIWVNQGEIPPDRYYNFTDVDFDGLITFWDLNDPINQGEYLITDVNGDGKISASDILAFDDGAGGGGWADSYDADFNGRVDDLVGWDFVSNNRTPNDSFGHGTHVAGTIGAVGDNFVGVAGVNFKTQIMVARIGPGPGINVTSAIAAIDYAVMMGIQVSNNSWGGTGLPTSLRNAVSRARDAGHIYVASAGNTGTNNDVSPSFPASYSTTLDNVIAVAATSTNDARASWSNYGVNSVQLGAPGVNINSTIRSGGYGTMSGTSMAAPHVAGAAAFLFSSYPGIDYQSVIYAILAGVDPVANLSGFVSTGGRLNLLNSLFILFGAAPGGGGSPGGGWGGGWGGDFESGFGGPAVPGFLALGKDSANLAQVAQVLTETTSETPLVLGPSQDVSNPEPTPVETATAVTPRVEAPRVETTRTVRVETERDLLFAELFGAW